MRSLTRMGQYLHLSEYALSFILAALATSLPEFFIGITSALRGVPALSLGNIVGASFLNITAVLGIVILFAGSLESGRTIKKEDIQVTFGMILFPALLILDGTLSRLDGFLLLFFFSGYIIYLLDQERATPAVNNMLNNVDVLRPMNKSLSLVGSGLIPSIPGEKERMAAEVARAELQFKNFLKEFGIFFLGAAFLVVSARWVVEEGILFGRVLGLPLFFIGILAAFGTTLPEAVFGVRSVILRHGSMSLGNAFGSIIVNISLVLGVVSVISPITADNPMRAVFGLLLTAILVILVELIRFLQGRLGRFFGAFLLGVAAAFVWIEAVL